MNHVLQIAVDGCSGSRKTMASRFLAEKYHLMMVDSGSLYCFAVQQLLEAGKNDPEQICEADLAFLDEITLQADGTICFRESSYSTRQLRKAPVIACVAEFSQMPVLRRKIGSKILEAIEGRPAVVNGRDIGTVLLPDAPIKFFFEVSEEFLRRDMRSTMLAETGSCDEALLEARLQAQLTRDHTDRVRTFAPLTQAADALRLDTGEMPIEQLYDTLSNTVDTWLQEAARPVLSILIPTYNRSAIVKTCLDRLLSYAIDGLEFVVCNDASQDDTAELLASYHDPRISVYHNERNAGASYNSHLSFSRARGKYALLISDEDDLFPEALAELVEFLRAQEDIAVYILGGIRGENDIKQFPEREYPDGFSALWQLGYCTRYMTGIIFHTDLYRKVIGTVSYEDAPRVFNVYSFMYAMAKLFFHGRVLTSDKLIFQENRFTATTMTNNIKSDPDTFYFEPKGRISQIRCSVASLAELPITREQKLRMLWKIYLDTADVSLRPFDPKYLPRYQEMIPETYQLFLSHISNDTPFAVLGRLMDTLVTAAEEAGICTEKQLQDALAEDTFLAEFVAARQEKIRDFMKKNNYS